MDIAGWREKIDELDRQLVKLLNDRARAAQEIGLLKRDRQTPIYEPVREKQIFENVKGHNQGPLPDRDLVHLYERIIDVMRKIQRDEAEPPVEESNRPGEPGGTEMDAEVNE